MFDNPQRLTQELTAEETNQGFVFVDIVNHHNRFGEDDTARHVFYGAACRVGDHRWVIKTIEPVGIRYWDCVFGHYDFQTAECCEWFNVSNSVYENASEAIEAASGPSAIEYVACTPPRLVRHDVNGEQRNVVLFQPDQVPDREIRQNAGFSLLQHRGWIAFRVHDSSAE